MSDDVADSRRRGVPSPILSARPALGTLGSPTRGGRSPGTPLGSSATSPSMFTLGPSVWHQVSSSTASGGAPAHRQPRGKELRVFTLELLDFFISDGDVRHIAPVLALRQQRAQIRCAGLTLYVAFECAHTANAFLRDSQASKYR